MKSTIVPIAIALLQPQLVVSDVDVHQQHIIERQEHEAERDLYSSETIAMDQVSEPCATEPPIVEAEYTGDDEFAGTNTTSPTLNPTPVPIANITVDPTAHPTPHPDNDDGGLSDDAYITTKEPTKKPTRHPSGKPSAGIGYLPTSSYHPTTDDWISGWMPTNPAVDDIDDWTGGYPIVLDDDKYNYVPDAKAGKSSGKSSKGGKSGKGSKSGSSDSSGYQGWGGGLSKGSSLVSSQFMASSAVAVGGRWDGLSTVAAVVSGMLVYLHA